MNYFSIIPTEVLLSDIPPRAVILYGVITSFVKKKGYAWVTDKALSQILKCGVSTIQRLLTSLEEKGFISREIIRNPETKQIEERRIYVVFDIGSVKNEGTPIPDNESTPTPKNEVDPTLKNERDINNNEYININKINTLLKGTFDSILEKWNSFENLSTHKESTWKRNLKPALIKRLKTYDPGEIEKAVENYAGILASDLHRWDYSWTLWDFLSRGLDRFLDESKPWEREKIRDNRSGPPGGYEPPDNVDRYFGKGG